MSSRGLDGDDADDEATAEGEIFDRSRIVDTPTTCKAKQTPD